MIFWFVLYQDKMNVEKILTLNKNPDDAGK